VMDVMESLEILWELNTPYDVIGFSEIGTGTVW